MPRCFFLIFVAVMISSLAQADSLRLEISGVDDELKTILETGLELPENIVKDGEINRFWLKRYQTRLSDRVAEILRPYGYFYTQAQSRVDNPAGDEYVLRLSVSPGEPLKITNLSVKVSGPGKDNSTIGESAGDFPLHVGDVLLQQRYEAGKASLRQSALNQGYLDASYVRHEILADLETRQVDIDLELTTGQRYRFGHTRFNGADNYSEKFLRRFLSHKRGEFFSYKLLNQSQLNFINADLFETVNIRPQLDQREDATVPVAVDVNPLPKHQLRPGIGYGTDTGARLSLRYRSLNLFKRGHEFKGNILLAQRHQSILSTYVLPHQKRLDTQILVHAGFDREDTKTYFSREVFSEIEYQRALSTDLSGSLFVRYSHEYSDFGEEENSSKLLLPGLRLAWRRLDNPVQPTRGLQAKITLQGSQESYLSDTSLLQLSGQITGLQPVTDTLSLLIRLQGGTTWHSDAFETLPASLRYFAGGNRSVRGYAFQSLGPENEDGDVVGGKHLMVGSLELEKRFLEKWGAAVFYDIGNAFNSFNDYELKQGAGIGLRRHTRIGALRLDLARQIGENDNRYRIHFSVGIGW